MLSLKEVGKVYNVSKGTMSKWVKDKSEIAASDEGSLRLPTANRYRPKHPALEVALHAAYRARRDRGAKVNGHWFMYKARRLYRELYPHLMDPEGIPQFKFSSRWFGDFRRRRRITRRRSNSKALKKPENYVPKLQHFHRFIRAKSIKLAEYHDIIPNVGGRCGIFRPCDIANFDQSPFPFDFLSGVTYSDFGESVVWQRGGGQSGMDKRQCTAMPCIFADGIDRVKPLLIFRGKGTNIMKGKERDRWDWRVSVAFQKDAWADEQIMLAWFEKQWKPITDPDHPKMLVFDSHAAQLTPACRKWLREHNTLAVVVPGGCTSLVQPLDVVVMREWKREVKVFYDLHVGENDDWFDTNKSAQERRVLMSEWIGAGWSRVANSKQDLIRRGFRKCGIAIKTDGSDDYAMNIPNLPHYSVGELTPEEIAEWVTNAPDPGFESDDENDSDWVPPSQGAAGDDYSDQSSSNSDESESHESDSASVSSESDPEPQENVMPRIILAHNGRSLAILQPGSAPSGGGNARGRGRSKRRGDARGQGVNGGGERGVQNGTGRGTGGGRGNRGRGNSVERGGAHGSGCGRGGSGGGGSNGDRGAGAAGRGRGRGRGRALQSRN